jgi:hypothetical protein
MSSPVLLRTDGSTKVPKEKCVPVGTTHIWDAASGGVQAVLHGLPPDRALAVGAVGHYRCTPGVERDLVYVVQTDDGQQTYTPEEFARKYAWKNDPEQVRPTGPER